MAKQVFAATAKILDNVIKQSDNYMLQKKNGTKENDDGDDDDDDDAGQCVGGL